MMGAGKSTAGRILAEITGREFLETDARIEELYGPIPALFERGEAVFRALEKEVVRAAAARTDAVVSTGGGVAVDPENVAALKKGGRIVYLAADGETLYARCRGTGRPLAESREKFFALLAAREPIYRAAADLIVDTDKKTPAEIAEEIRKKEAL